MISLSSDDRAALARGLVRGLGMDYNTAAEVASLVGRRPEPPLEPEPEASPDPLARVTDDGYIVTPNDPRWRRAHA